jgi:hypothetical protein
LGPRSQHQGVKVRQPLRQSGERADRLLEAGRPKDTLDVVVQLRDRLGDGPAGRRVGGEPDVPYTRAAYLTKIQYGQRDGAVYSTSPAAGVTRPDTSRATTCAAVSAQE